jgi:glycine/D-amino acid oxidase-like deaminating enzyme
LYPGDALVNPREVMLALAAALQRSKVSVIQDCQVYGARVTGRDVVLWTKEGVRCFGALVIAAGAWSNSLDIQGVPAIPSVEPVKGHLIGYQQPQDTCRTVLRRGPTYMLQRANGLLICGSSSERVGFNRKLDPEIVESLAREAGFLFPHLRDAVPSEAWVGFRPASDPIQMGPWHSKRLYLAYGHYRNGILLAPLTAQQISNEITASLRTQ